MCEARRAEYVRLLDEEGMNFTQAAHAVGVSKRTGKAWRNGRTRATGRNEKPLVDWYRSTMDKPKTLHPRYLSQEERIQIADRLRLGDSIRAIARLLGRDDIGQLAPGKCADLFLIDSRHLEFVGSCFDAGSVLGTVGVRGPVDYTVVHGKVTVRHGRLVTVDEDRVAREANEKCRAYLNM